MQRTVRTLLAASAALFLASPAGAVQPEASPMAEAAEAKPKADISAEAQAVIDKYVEASGGAEAFKSIKSLHSKGTISIPSQGISGTQELFFAEGPRLLVVQTLTGIGEFRQGITGDKVWSMDPISGPQLMPEDAAKDVMDSADPRSPLLYATLYKTITHAGETEFEGKNVVALELADHDGDTSTQYFDPGTGLMVGSKGVSDTPQGRLEIVSLMQDYKQFGPLKLPSKTVQKLGIIEIVSETTDFSVNEVDASVFEPPAAVKVLLEG